MPHAPPQLTPVPGDPILAWSAAAWLAATRVAGDPFVDAQMPWCPGEPNNHGGNERCTGLLTACSSSGSGTALVNDFECGQRLRVMCAVAAAPHCSQGKPGCNGQSADCIGMHSLSECGGIVRGHWT
jgi:hypothetical protein